MMIIERPDGAELRADALEKLCPIRVILDPSTGPSHPLCGDDDPGSVVTITQIVTAGDQHNPGGADWIRPRCNLAVRCVTHVALHLGHLEGDSLASSDDLDQVAPVKLSKTVKDACPPGVGVPCQNCASALSGSDTSTPRETHPSRNDQPRGNLPS